MVIMLTYLDKRKKKPSRTSITRLFDVYCEVGNSPEKLMEETSQFQFNRMRVVLLFVLGFGYEVT
jgi:hypothetical protein